MASNNYSELGKPFPLRGDFRVLWRDGLQRDPSADYDDIAEGGQITDAGGLRALIGKANILRLADFGNGQRGLYLECDGCGCEHHQDDTLIEKAIPLLAFNNPGFAKDLIHHFAGDQKERILEAIVSQARHPRSGGFMGDPAHHMAELQKKFADQIAAFPDRIRTSYS